MKITTVVVPVVGLAASADAWFTGEDYNKQRDKFIAITQPLRDDAANYGAARPVKGCTDQLPFDEGFHPGECKPRSRTWKNDVNHAANTVNQRFEEFRHYWDGLGQVWTWFGLKDKPNTIEPWVPFMEMLCCKDTDQDTSPVTTGFGEKEDDEEPIPQPAPEIPANEVGAANSAGEGGDPAKANAEPEPLDWECDCGGEKESTSDDKPKDETQQEKVEVKESGKVVEATPQGAIVQAAQGAVWVPGMGAAVGSTVALLSTAGGGILATVLIPSPPATGSAPEAEQKEPNILQGIKVEKKTEADSKPDTPSNEQSSPTPPSQAEVSKKLPPYEPQSIDVERQNLRDFHDLIAKNSDSVPNGLCSNKTARCTCAIADKECRQANRDGKQFAGYFLAKFKACPNPKQNWVGGNVCKV